MRAPKGFGKRYFTLSAVQAYSGGAVLARAWNSTRAHHRMVSEECDEDSAAEEDDTLLLETAIAELPGGRRRACHCNHHFHRRTRRALRHHARPHTPPVPYRHTRSTLSPPCTLPLPHPDLILKGTQ